jgi:glutaredoxin
MPDPYPLKPAQIMMYTTKYCTDCVRVKAFFDANGVSYIQIPIEDDEDATRFVTQVNRGMHSVPTIVFPDGDVLVEPGWADLRKKLRK